MYNRYMYQTIYIDNIYNKKGLKIPKGQSESAYRRTDNRMAKGKTTKGQTMINKTYI